MSFYKDMDGASFDQLLDWWNAVDLPAWVDSRALFLDEVAYALTKCGADGVRFLKSYARDADFEKRISAVYFLADKKFVDDEVLQYLAETFALDNLRSKTLVLWGYIHIEQFPLSRDEAEKLMKHSDDRMSALAMVYLSHAYPAETFEILKRGLSSPNPRQRQYACDEVGDRGIVALKDDVTRLLQDSDEDVRETARLNLEICFK